MPDPSNLGETRLTEEQARQRRDVFVREYVIDYNGSRAAIAAGYSERSARCKASQLLKEPSVKEAVEQARQDKLAELGYSLEKVLAELGKVGFANVGDFLSEDEAHNVVVDLQKVKGQMGAAVAEFTIDQTEKFGEVVAQKFKIKLHDKTRPLQLLGQFHKAFTDKTEISGPDGKSLDAVPPTFQLTFVKPKKEGDNEGKG